MGILGVAVLLSWIPSIFLYALNLHSMDHARFWSLFLEWPMWQEDFWLDSADMTPESSVD
jgi:hypothetical protein